jgi:methenyltetrahydrofolate cyclohydrolase
MPKLTKLNIKAFLDELASSSPAPGGGSVAAFAGALGAALTSMVCNLTIGKKGYETAQQEIIDVLHESEQLRKHLTDLIEKDTEAFNEVMTALKLPKETDEQKQTRQQALQIAFKHAAEVPLETTRACMNVMDVAKVVAEKGNKNSISDAAVSTLMAQAGVQAAMLNVRINLTSIKDEDYIQKVSNELHDLLQKSMEKTAVVLGIVEQSL